MQPDPESLARKLQSFGDALQRLEEALSLSAPSSLEKDGSIQRFEFTLETAWKTLRSALLNESLETGTPKSAISGAFQSGWIQDESLWLEMLKARNEASHLYREARAAEIYSRLSPFTLEMRKLHGFLGKKFGIKLE